MYCTRLHGLQVMSRRVMGMVIDVDMRKHMEVGTNYLRNVRTGILYYTRWISCVKMFII
jgi:hypothetical protein